jgi:hypothetical protein
LEVLAVFAFAGAFAAGLITFFATVFGAVLVEVLVVLVVLVVFCVAIIYFAFYFVRFIMNQINQYIIEKICLNLFYLQHLLIFKISSRLSLTLIGCIRLFFVNIKL